MPKGLRKIVCALLVAGVAGGVILAGNRPLAVPVAGVQTPSAPGAPAQDPESNKVVDFVADRGYPIPYGDTTATVLVGHFAAQHTGRSLPATARSATTTSASSASATY